MSELITVHSSQAMLPTLAPMPAPLPEPRVTISIRTATLGDLAFIDSLQKKTSKMVGFMPTKQIEGKIAAEEVLIAESDEATKRRSDGATKGKRVLLYFPPSLRRFVAPSLFVLGI